MVSGIFLTAWLAGSATTASALTISTFDPGGADAEVRESNVTQNRGASTELGSRVGYIRNSHIYMKWSVEGVTAADLAQPITIRNFLRHENLAENRIKDMDGVAPDEGNAGFDFYVLDPAHVGANWVEVDPGDGSGITYENAPGLTPDADTLTKDIDTSLGNFTFLGTRLFRDLNDENHLPVGEAFDIILNPGSLLHQAIQAALATDHQTVTVLATTHHGASSTVADWLNFNYMFNPKEQDPIRIDADYDMNVSVGDGAEGSPWGGMANDMGQFAPQLIFAPEPGSLALAAFGLAAFAAWRRRRWAVNR
jgi:MYXO-CTERM domain-containing protein